MSLAFTGGMVGWGSIASSSIIPSEIIGDYTQSLSTATASSESTTNNVSFQLGGAKEYSNAYIYLNTTSPEYERKYVVQTISADSDLVGVNITKVRWKGSRYNGANGDIETGFSTRSAFCGNGTIQSSFGSITLSGSNAERNWDFTHSGSGYTIPNACTVLVLKCSTNNGGFFKVPFAGANSNDFEDSSTFSSGGKGGASNDAVDNDATCNVTCSQTHTRNVAEMYLYYDLVEGASKAVDSSTTNKWKSNSEATPTLTVDMGSAIDLADLAIFPHSDTTVTTLGIEISTDNSTFTEMKEVETSDLTNGQWNFIGLSTGISARYVRIKSKDSSNAVLAINEVKVRAIPVAPSIDDDFSSDNFTNVGSQSGWGVSSGAMNWTTARGSTVQGEYIALPSTFSGDFVVRFKLTPTTVSHVGDPEEYLWMGLTNSASCNSATSQNQAGMYFHNYSTGDSKYQVTYKTNGGLFGGASATSTNFSSTVYYIEISKSSDTVTLKLFSDSGYSTLVSSATSTAGGATDSYTHFVLTGMYHGSSSGGGSSLGTIDDLKIYKDISSL
jgi:hypothetical protein